MLRDSSRAEALLEASTATVTCTEEGRAFFQKRLSIFGFCVFVLAGTSWVALALAYFVGGQAARVPGEHAPFSTGGVLHLTNALLAGALWVATQRGRLPSLPLHALDIGVSLGLITVWGLTGATLPNSTAGTLIALLAFITGTLARAIVVPSTSQRTLAIGLLGGAVIVGTVIWRRVSGQETSIVNVVASGCWIASGVTLAAVASHTIFGLRRQVEHTKVLGQYTLETKIGEGGMGGVWRASHALLRRPTAVKLLLAGHMGETAIRRFEREVQLTARLTHPNSVAIYDYGRTRDGIFYYAMELIEGADLERLVAEDGAQPPGRVVHVLTQICGALAEAHDLGLVHRDVKPANVLLSPRKNEHEFAKIVDFGLVKSIDAKATQPTLTATNMITGTPLYMSPEAIQTPDAVDSRSDLYSLGAVAWFLLSGRPPFEGGSIVEILGKHLHVPPSRPSAVLGQPLPIDLEDIVLGCLEKRPDARPLDARALRSRLEACSAAGRWTADQAADWWRARAPRAPRSPSTGPRTMALDVGSRAEATGDALIGL
jgi:serine/threonine-protein kinase